MIILCLQAGDLFNFLLVETYKCYHSPRCQVLQPLLKTQALNSLHCLLWTMKSSVGTAGWGRRWCFPQHRPWPPRGFLQCFLPAPSLLYPFPPSPLLKAWGANVPYKTHETLRLCRRAYCRSFCCLGFPTISFHQQPLNSFLGTSVQSCHWVFWPAFWLSFLRLSQEFKLVFEC